MDEIEHIIVLMMENRSFDHTLGYLSLPAYSSGAPPVNGLREQPFSNPYTGNEFRYDEEELVHRTRPLYPDSPPVHRLPALTPLWEDPPHEADSQEIQINSGAMDGFVDAYAGRLHERLAEYGRKPAWPVLGYPLGYLEPKDIPVYDHLARTYSVCDNWFCSVRGPTMTNRFFSLAGTTNGIMDNNRILVHRRNAFTSFFRYLRPETKWRWYSSDPAVLRAVDDEYLRETHDDHFAYFDQATERQSRSFLSDLFGSDDQEPELPNVAWIDPNFAITAKDGHLISNDDHPPAPVIRGQKLVNKLYETLRTSEYWSRSLLVITYDEHGGFFDHEPPPRPELGPRVPTLLISPWVKPGCYSVELDHAALIKTILTRFGAEGAIEKMPERVQVSADLWGALGAERIEAGPVPDPGEAALSPDDLRPFYLPKPASTIPRAVELLDRAPTDLQADVARMAIILRSGLRNYFRLQGWVKRRTNRRRPKLSQTPLKALVALRRRVQPRDRRLEERHP